MLAGVRPSRAVVSQVPNATLSRRFVNRHNLREHVKQRQTLASDLTSLWVYDLTCMVAFRLLSWRHGPLRTTSPRSLASAW